MRDDLLILRYAGDSVDASALERQLGRLVRRGYVGARFTDAVTATTRGRVLVVTFDTDNNSVVDAALAVLRRLELVGTVFVSRAGAGEPALPADALRRLGGCQWEIGARGRSDIRLGDLSDAELAAELRETRAALETVLGTPCRAYAYADGTTDPRVMAAVQDAGFHAAAGTARGGFQVPLTLNWPRVTLSGEDNARAVWVKTWPELRRLRAFPVGSRSTESRFAEGGAAPAAASPPWAGTRITVLIPCHNDGRLLVEAVESVAEPEPVEIIIVDDASTDPETLDVLDTLRARGVHVIRHDHNRGLPAARMTGLAATSAPYVFPLDADDLVVAGALATMADLMDADPSLAVTFGDYREFGTHEGVRRVPARLDPYRLAYRNDYPVSSLFRRRSLVAAGGWRQVGNEVGYEDWHLWMTLAERGEEGRHWGHGAVLQRRLHGQRMLSDTARRHLALYATLRTLHPELFARVRETRRETTLSPVGRWLYPAFFGWRPRLSLWSRVLRLLRPVRS